MRRDDHWAQWRILGPLSSRGIMQADDDVSIPLVSVTVNSIQNKNFTVCRRTHFLK